MKKKICSLCKIQIKEKIDDWYENTLFEKGRKIDEIYFHRECYKKFHKEKFKQEYQNKIREMRPFINNLIGGIGKKY